MQCLSVTLSMLMRPFSVVTPEWSGSALLGLMDATSKLGVWPGASPARNKIPAVSRLRFIRLILPWEECSHGRPASSFIAAAIEMKWERSFPFPASVGDRRPLCTDEAPLGILPNKHVGIPTPHAE